jgi:hypothetical protein
MYPSTFTVEDAVNKFPWGFCLIETTWDNKRVYHNYPFTKREAKAYVPFLTMILKDIEINGRYLKDFTMAFRNAPNCEYANMSGNVGKYMDHWWVHFRDRDGQHQSYGIDQLPAVIYALESFLKRGVQR